jgi:hypothetical protein
MMVSWIDGRCSACGSGAVVCVHGRIVRCGHCRRDILTILWTWRRAEGEGQ